jgi:hypothetical protein
MKIKAVLVLIKIAVLLSSLFVGCGVSQEEYDDVNAQLKASQAQLVELQNKFSELKEKYEIVGETPAETAQNVVKRYHETHIYSEYDFFVCSDMALDVWDMLKAQGISAVIQIGNVKTPTDNITEADHAWVLAEVSLGKYLALETTGGYAVWPEENPLYYSGWAFHNPQEYKRFVKLEQQYNILDNIINGLIGEAQIVLDEYNKESNRYKELLDEFNTRYVGHPVSLEAFNFRDKIESQLAIAKETEGRYNQLNELINEQLKELENIDSEMRGLVD